MNANESSSRGGWLGCGLILMAILVCTVGSVVAIDVGCNQQITNWLRIYPGATVESLTYEYVRPWATGRTEMLLRTSDKFATVNSWYVDQLRQVAGQGGIATTQHQVSIDQSTGDTLIYLTSECAR